MNPVMLGLLALIAVGYQVPRLFSPSRHRRREARAIRGLLLAEINDGIRSFDDPAVRELLSWCNRRAPRGRFGVTG